MIRIIAELEQFMRQDAYARKAIGEARSRIIADALAHGASVTELHDEITIEYPREIP